VGEATGVLDTCVHGYVCVYVYVCVLGGYLDRCGVRKRGVDG